ncbi:arginase-1 [Anoplophora glabripennis]|uniref:arginase-1 n=1 Tax=Anoplophora glabripennis TaxID=217634 RepID=UPI000873740C|nr:arginase-1 [Anoplophora glabripennis]
MLRKVRLRNGFEVLKRYLHTERETKIGILGVPFDKGQPKVGVANGPDAIRKAGLVEQLAGIHKKINIKDYGNITYQVNEEIEKKVPNMREYAHVASCNQELSRNVEKIIKDGRICLTLGGDHSIGIGTVDGHIKSKNEDICLLWIDAHADLNTNKTSPSGNVHGMPMALLASELADYWPYLPGMDWQQPVMSIRNVAYIGLRSVDSYERLVIDKLGITAFGMDEVENYGIGTVVNMALDRIDPERRRSIHVSFDIDSLDSLEAPSTGTPVRGGLTLREGVHIMEMIYKTGRLGAMDLVEVNPGIGSEQDVKRTIEAAIHVILAAFGHSRKGLRLKDASLPLQTFPPTRQTIQ